MIGSRLIAVCRARNIPCSATSRRKSSRIFGMIHLDLTGHESGWDIPDDVHAAVICAGMTGLAACENNPVLSRTVNVNGTHHLIEFLKRSGIRVVFLSTNQVFDGQRPLVPVDGERHPVSVYGRQKASVESQLLSLEGHDAVVRLAKVVYPTLPLFDGWKQSLMGGHPISAYANMLMAPVHIDQVVEVILNIVQGAYHGIFHLSPAEDISYAGVGCVLAEKYGVSKALVRPVHVNDSELPVGGLPVHTTLDTSVTSRQLGIRPMGAWEAIDRILKDEE